MKSEKRPICTELFCHTITTFHKWLGVKRLKISNLHLLQDWIKWTSVESTSKETETKQNNCIHFAVFRRRVSTFKLKSNYLVYLTIFIFETTISLNLISRCPLKNHYLVQFNCDITELWIIKFCLLH